jgi:hypothetical protein
MMLIKFDLSCIARMAVAVSLVSAGSMSFAIAAHAQDVEAQARESWRESIVRTAVPGEGCFYAAYPSTFWAKVACTVAPNRQYRPRTATAGRTVGDGNDYAASVTGLMTSAVGTFPKVTDVTGEKDDGESGDYSLQLNSNFMNTAVCAGHSGCQSWQQFVYSSGEESVFMQYWLISYGTCPKGWFRATPDCYKNSAAVTAPKQPVTQLANLKVSGTAVANGTDTMVFTTETEAYSTTGPDSVVDLATGWNQSEFNVIGDGGGSEANFNKGASITVKIAVANGTTSAPTCDANDGTTGETNNLTLGGCRTFSGSTPSIEFVEAN